MDQKNHHRYFRILYKILMHSYLQNFDMDRSYGGMREEPGKLLSYVFACRNFVTLDYFLNLENFRL